MSCRRTFCAITLAATAIVALGCSHPVDDKQLAQRIASQIQQDNAIAGQITVVSAGGMVALSGQVPNDAARSLAARIAADTPGVKQVVNNIVVAPASAAVPPAPTAASARHVRERPRPAREHSAAATAEPPEEAAINTPVAQPAPAEPAPQVASAPPVNPAPAEVPQAAPPPPPAPVKYTIPAGAVISVRLIDALSSKQNKPGDVFRATLKSPLRVDDHVVVPAGADIEGKVVEAESAGTFKGHASLKLVLTKLTSHGHSYPLSTEDYDQANANRGKGTAETVGGGAALGAIIGAIAGGGKGAGIGTLAGAGAGGAGRAIKKDKGINFPSESLLSFKLQYPLTVTVQPGEKETAER
ncbi:MAG TPA: BON domain-containing protein [Bryobacteraceae bacterium]|nr:BON domain-containing protein [Bryobacteraceae bacterium]